MKATKHCITLLVAALSLASLGANADDALIKKGEYLTRAADCEACHTTAGGQPFAGGTPFKTPMGTLFSPNITPDKDTGIGNWTDAQFLRAVHEGKGKDGENLYPAFPYTDYTALTDDDVLAIKAYLMSTPPVHNVVPANQMPFPFNQRWSLMFWNLINFKEGRFKPQPQQSEAWNRGAYLVDALGHCGQCHTPRDITMGLKDSKKFAGADLAGWKAFNISSHKQDGIGSWSDDEIIRYLGTGNVPGRAQAGGPMAEVIEKSTRHLSEADLKAMVTYLRSVPAQANDIDKARSEQGAPIASLAAVRGAPIKAEGANLYSGNCASCHQWSGGGIGNGYYPSLYKNSVVGADNANNLVLVMLQGVQRDMGNDKVVMPAFGRSLTDEQIANLANYVGKQFGGADYGLKAADVAELRKAGLH
ncbi:cytochrome c [Pseudomonas sp. App30]|uniref:c-type cytochrome n=1 Tax=Pseudomonas sp. App30 TaxID=3068990 RepID=UPI003A80A989